MTNAQLRCDGQWLSSIGAWGEVEREDRADGGCWELTWRMELPRTFDHPALRRGALVELMVGNFPVWAGELAEPDRTEWRFVARGLSRLAEGFIALKADGTTTSTADTAIDQAIANGLPWRRPDSIGATAVTTGDTTEGVNYLHTVLDANADMLGQRWGVDARGVVFCRADGVFPRWYMTPGSGALGIADDEYATHLVGRYRASTTTFATTTIGDARSAARWGRREVPVDLTGRGVISLTSAQTHLTNLLAKIGPRPGWANSLEPAPYELVTRGGIPANPYLVRPGNMVRLFGIQDENLQPAPYIDFVIGAVRHDLSAGTLRIDPVGLADRDLSSIIASANDPTAYKG